MKRAFTFPNSLQKELVKLDQEENFDLIHCMNINSIFAAKVKEKLNKPFLAHVNAPNLFCPRGTKFKEEPCQEKCTFFKFLSCHFQYGKISKLESKWYLHYNPFFLSLIYYRYQHRKNYLPKFDRFLPISSYMKKLLLQEGIPEEKTTIIPNPVELEKFLQLEPKRNKVPKVLYLGSYEKFKGPQILLKALTQLNLKFEANFYGSGSLKKELKDKSSHLNNIHIHDKVDYSKFRPFTKTTI